MINREMRPVSVLTYIDTKDVYGQKRQQGYLTRDINMVCKIYQQTNTSDIRYVEVSLIGLTYDKDITDKNAIKIGNDIYDVLYVIPSGRLYQIMMRKK